VACRGYPDPFHVKSFSHHVSTDKATGLPPILPKPASVLFQTERDYRYFQSFCESTAAQLDGLIPSDLWSQLILQIGDYNPSIRHGIIAIAALDIISQISNTTNKKEHWLDINDHRHYALQQYSLAIRNVRGLLSKGDKDLNTILIMCLVIICFETFQGNHECAFAHIAAGLRFIEEESTRTQIPGQKRSTGFNPSVLGSIDESLVRAFLRLDIQARSFIHIRATDDHTFTPGLCSIPTQFRDLKEARNYLEGLTRRYLRLASSMMPPDEHGGITGMQTFSEVAASLKDLRSRPDMEEGARWFGECIHQWQEAFDPLLIEARTYQGRANLLGATILKYQYFNFWFALGFFQPSGEIPRKWIDLTPFVREVITLARTFLQHPDTSPNGSLFSVDFPMLHLLFKVALTCPHTGLRREATDLLLSTPRREWLWNGKIAGRLAQKIIHIEEENIEGDFVPEHKRMTGMGLSFDLKARTVTATAIMPRGEKLECITVKEDLDL